MPIYEFKCEDCNNIDEVLMRVSDANPTACSKCGKAIHKIMSVSSFALKGSGWYATDYKSKAPNSTSCEAKENCPASGSCPQAQS